MTRWFVHSIAAALALSVAGFSAPTVAAPTARADDSQAPPAISERDTFSRVVLLPPMEVSTSRFSQAEPPARTTLDHDQVRAKNWGQDTPMALATLTGAYAYSDAGNGVGYSYLSIRGFPQRRISVLINGVPLNDPESHEVYWIDHPDLLASTSQLTVQRGVGSDLYGAAAVGGAVNIETSPFTQEPEQNVTVAYGSFETKRLSIESNSGDLPGGWNTYGRYSRIESSGYRDQSWSRLWSYTISARKILDPRQSLQLNLYGGPEETHLAYLGVPRAELASDRRRNPITYRNERDHFFEPHYELLHTWSPATNVTLSQTLFWFDGRGYYDEQRFGRSLADYRLSPWQTSDSTLAPRDYYAQDPGGALTQDGGGRFTLERSDLVRRRSVTNRHYGWIPRVALNSGRNSKLILGGELRFHDGRHFGELKAGSALPPGTAADFAYYDYHPHTLATGAFARFEWNARGRLRGTADLAWRHVSYSMRDDRFDGIGFEQKYDFLNPRLGLDYAVGGGVTALASWAQTRREPAFRDLYDAEGVGNAPLFARRDAAGLWVDPLIRPERVNDLEAGVEFAHGSNLPAEEAAAGGTYLSMTLNFFRMDFQDELVYAGQFNTDLGYAILGNAAKSVHQGLEAGFAMRGLLSRSVSARLGANATLSDNHFVRYREVYGTTPADVVSYDGKALGFFPATLANVSGSLGWQGLDLGVEAQHAGRIYLDNTESSSASLPPRTVFNLSARYSGLRGAARRVSAGIRVLNVFDRKYEAGGYMDYDATGALVPHVVPAATRAVMGELGVRF